MAQQNIPITFSEVLNVRSKPLYYSKLLLRITILSILFYMMIFRVLSYLPINSFRNHRCQSHWKM